MRVSLFSAIARIERPFGPMTKPAASIVILRTTVLWQYEYSSCSAVVHIMQMAPAHEKSSMSQICYIRCQLLTCHQGKLPTQSPDKLSDTLVLEASVLQPAHEFTNCKKQDGHSIPSLWLRCPFCILRATKDGNTVYGHNQRSSRVRRIALEDRAIWRTAHRIQGLVSSLLLIRDCPGIDGT